MKKILLTHYYDKIALVSLKFKGAYTQTKCN